MKVVLVCYILLLTNIKFPKWSRILGEFFKTNLSQKWFICRTLPLKENIEDIQVYKPKFPGELQLWSYIIHWYWICIPWPLIEGCTYCILIHAMRALAVDAQIEIIERWRFQRVQVCVLERSPKFSVHYIISFCDDKVSTRSVNL